VLLCDYVYMMLDGWSSNHDFCALGVKQAN
jgi:hypothetical protein